MVHTGVGTLARSEKHWKQSPGSTTLPPKKYKRRRRRTQKEINVQTELTWPRVFTQLQHRVPPVPTTNQLGATDFSGCCRECCLHRTKRTVFVKTETNTPAVWDAVRATTRGHAVTKEQSNLKPPYKYQRPPCFSGLSGTRCSTDMIPNP